jgi:hypothetical protein
MTSMKIVVGAAMAALLAVNVFGAVALFNGVSTFERVGNVAERFTDGGDRQAGQSEYRSGDFDDDDSNGGDFDGGESGWNFQAPSFIGGPPSPGFFEGKGKGKGGERSGRFRATSSRRSSKARTVSRTMRSRFSTATDSFTKSSSRLGKAASWAGSSRTRRIRTRWRTSSIKQA